MSASTRDVEHGELLAQMGWVRRLALGLVGDPNVADDVAQDALTAALTRPPRQTSGPGLRAWLARVTRTYARQTARGEGRRRRREERAAEPEATASTADVVARGALQRRLVEAVMELDEPYRSAVLYRYLDGLAAPEVAARTGATPAAARKRISRGLEKLRERFDREHGADGAAWMQALIPLTGALPYAAPPGVTPMVGGALAVSTQLKLVAGAAVVVVLAVAVGSLDEDARPPRELPEPAAEPDLEPVAEALPAAAAPTDERVEVAAAPSLDPEGDRGGDREGVGHIQLEVAPVAAAGALLTGLVVDEREEPVADARVFAAFPTLNDGNRELLSLFGPRYGNRVHGARTDADGRFRIEGVEEGIWRLWAGRHPLQWAHTDELRVGADEEVPTVRLVLNELGAANRIDALVLCPDGTPLAGAEVEVAEEGQEDMFIPLAETGADGRVVLPILRGTSYAVHALDPEQRWGAVTATDVAAGTRELVLRFIAGRVIELTTLDESGRSLDDYFVRVACEGETFPVFYEEEQQVEGRLRLGIPDLPFEVKVSAPGYAARAFGPFDPLAAPAELTCTLTKLATVSGRLTARGEPVTRGVVQLVRYARDARKVCLVYGFPARLDGRKLQGVYTDAEGRFTLPIEESAEYALYAEADGWDCVEQGPLQLDPTRSERIDLNLTGGGSIEGRLIVPAGVDPDGMVVRASRGDMRVRVAIVDAQGRYRFDRMAAGPWMVKGSREQGMRSTGGSRAAVAIEEITLEHDYAFPWDCDVVDGETTWHDVHLSEPWCGVEGSVTIDGAATPYGSVRVVRDSRPWTWELPESTVRVLDLDGRYELTGLAAGDYWHTVRLTGGALDGVSVVRRLSLTDEGHRLDVALHTSPLRFDGEAQAGEYAVVVAADGASVVVPLRREAGGALGPATGVVGEARLVRRGDGDESEDALRWPTVLEMGRLTGAARAFRLP